MKNFFIIGMISLATGSVGVATEIQVTFTNGAVRTLPEIRIDNGYIQMAEGRFELSKISSVQFNTDPLSAENCRILFQAGRYGEIVSGLADVRTSLQAAVGLPGNSSILLEWLLKASFWQGDYAAVNEMSRVLKSSSASLYTTLGLIVQGRLEDAEIILKAIANRTDVSPVMLEYARARLAFSREQYKEALQYVAQADLLHRRDAEWEPATLFLAGLIYVKTGRTEAASYVAEELTLGWPDSIWSRRAAELKESKTEGKTS